MLRLSEKEVRMSQKTQTQTKKKGSDVKMQQRVRKNLIPMLIAAIMVFSLFMGYIPVAMAESQQHNDLSTVQPFGAIMPLDASISDPPKLVIGFVYFGTDNASSCTNSFVEIYNPNDFSVTLTNTYALQYKSMASSGSQYTPDWIKLDLVGDIPAHGSFLVNFGSTGSVPNGTVGRLDLSDKTFDQNFVWPDGITPCNKGVKIVITSNQDRLPSDLMNPFDGDGNGQVAGYVDMFGISGNDTTNPSVDGYETAALLAGDGAAQSKQKGFARIGGDGVKYEDTDNNVNDFQQVDFRSSDLTDPMLVPRSLEDGAWEQPSVSTSTFTANDLTLTPGSDQSEMNFTWISDSTDNTASVVQVSKTSDLSSGTFMPATTITTTNGTVGNAAAGESYHKAGVTGLAAGTEYSYRVSNDGVNFSQTYTFKTGPSGDFQFIAVGDPQLNGGTQPYNGVNPVTSTAAGWQNTLDKISANFPDASFIAGVGDQVDTNSNESQYADFFAPEQMTSLPFSPAVGNHEGDLIDFEWHFNIPNETAGSYFGNYWYVYNNSLFVVLNTAPYPATSAEVDQYTQVMDATLKAATDANPNVQWIFVQNHKSPTSIADHEYDSDVLLWTPAFEALMDKYHVDFVLSGHDHVYSRSYFIFGGEKVDGIDYSLDSVTNPQGTLYFTLNTASGMKYYDIRSASSGSNPEWIDSTDGLYVEKNGTVVDVSGYEGKPWYANVGIQIYTPQFTAVDVTSDHVAFTTYRTDTMTVVDQYTVYKTTEDNPVTGVSLDKDQLSLKTGGSGTITATVTPSDATDASVTWTSSNTSVATVDQNGKVTGVAAGTADITVTTTDGGYQSVCTVTIIKSSSGTGTGSGSGTGTGTNGNENSNGNNGGSDNSGTNTTTSKVSVSLASLNLNVGDTKKLTATVTPANASVTTSWASSNTSVATVDQNGNVKAVGEGTATITATTSDGAHATCALTVKSDNSGNGNLLLYVAITVTALIAICVIAYVLIGGKFGSA